LTFEELGLTVVERLDATGVPYMLTGALAVNYHGMPRATHDVDVVVQISDANVDRIEALFKGDFFIDGLSVSNALHEFSMLHHPSRNRVES
jgi:hypothetical protein